MRTPTAAAAAAGHPRYLPLAARFAVVVLLLTVGMTAILLAWLLPRTTTAFARLGADYLRDGAAAMHELSLEQSALNGDVLIDVLQSYRDDRVRALRELRLEDYGGGAAAMRDAIAADDARRGAHERQNVIALTSARQARADASIESRLRSLEAAQAVRTDEFVGELRTVHLVLVALTLAAVLVALGFGLRRVVLLPVLRLREATRRVAHGDLDVAPPPPPRDELGLLAEDFAAMTAQLRTARAEQQRYTADLAHQVADKTKHLELALVELRESHGRLAKADRLAALGTLAGGVAHEFRNVIGGIRGCAAELAADERDAERKETLAVITRAADRGSGIVQQLLRFARRSVERTSDVDPNTIVDDALRLCEPAARHQGVAVERTFANGLSLQADADGLHQVLVNLILNAVQAMPKGGALRLHTARADGGVAITVADTGSGIDGKDLPHVFEPFFTTKARADDAGRTGSGLGLSVSWGIVAAHRGRIEVTSTPGAGTTFTVWLPLQQEQPAA